MKGFLFFLVGLLSGALLTYYFYPELNEKIKDYLPLVADSTNTEEVENFDSPAGEENNEPEMPGELTLFDEPGDMVTTKGLMVTHIFDNGAALADELHESLDMPSAYGVTVLLLCNEDKSYYDRQIIRIPAGKCARQTGIYKYSEYGMAKTVPVVTISDR